MPPQIASVHRLLARDEFLAKYQISNQEFVATGLQWAELKSVFEDYSGWCGQLPSLAEHFASTLRQCPAVHVAKSRAKSPEKLIEKIIRRSIEEGHRWASRANYIQRVPDLVGVRAIYLMHEQWPIVHNFILANLPVKRNPKPIAYIQSPIPARIRSAYRDGGVKIQLGKHGYQSVHYEMRHQVGKKVIRVEVQARTLYQEAWGEISHVTAYPYRKRVALLVQTMTKLANLTAKADHFSSAIDGAAHLWDSRVAGRMPQANIVDSFVELVDFLREYHPEISGDLTAASSEFSVSKLDETFNLPRL